MMNELDKNELDNFKIFKDNKSTLREISKDDHDVNNIDYMTNSMIIAINFDGVKLDYIKNISILKDPKSNDALLLGDDGEYYFIEFKNGVIGRKKSRKSYEIRLKILESLLIFTDIINECITFTREKMNYILVYNEEKNPLPKNQLTKEENVMLQISPSRVDFAKHLIEKKAKKKFIRFNLEKFEKLYFKNVYTYDKSTFESNIVQIFSRS